VILEKYSLEALQLETSLLLRRLRSLATQQRPLSPVKQLNEALML
jgi:hypothetical protein